MSVSLMTLVKCVQGLLFAVPCLKNCLLYKYPLSMSCVQFCCLVSIVFVLCLLFLSCVYFVCLVSIVLYLLSFVSYLLSCAHLSVVLRQLFPVYFRVSNVPTLLYISFLFIVLSLLSCVFHLSSIVSSIVYCLLYVVHVLCPWSIVFSF